MDPGKFSKSRETDGFIQGSLHLGLVSLIDEDGPPEHSWSQIARQLNDKQLYIALKEGKPVVSDPYHVFLSGPCGVGKSHVIRLIDSDTFKLLKLYCCLVNFPHWRICI